MLATPNALVQAIGISRSKLSLGVAWAGCSGDRLVTGTTVRCGGILKEQALVAERQTRMP